MKRGLLWIAAVAAMALPSCKEKPVQAEEYPILPIEERDYGLDTDSVGGDTVRHEAPPAPARNTHSYPSGARSKSYHDYGDDNSDGMRGFDPATEDDLEDNGMTRYMENTDERGWM